MSERGKGNGKARKVRKARKAKPTKRPATSLPFVELRFTRAELVALSEALKRAEEMLEGLDGDDVEVLWDFRQRLEAELFDADPGLARSERLLRETAALLEALAEELPDEAPAVRTASEALRTRAGLLGCCG